MDPSFLNQLPFGVLIAEPLLSRRHTILDFSIQLFNPLAMLELAGLADWSQGVTFRKLFPNQMLDGLDEVCVQVYQTGTIYQENQYSAQIKGAVLTSLESFKNGALVLNTPTSCLASGSSDKTQLLRNWSIQFLKTKSSGLREKMPLSREPFTTLIGRYKRGFNKTTL